MNKKVIAGFVLAFAAGGAVGVFATRQYFKTYYEDAADEEIESVKKALKRPAKRFDDGADSDIVKEGTDAPERSESRAEVSETDNFDRFGRQKDAPQFDPKGYLKYTNIARNYDQDVPDAKKPSLEELAALRGYNDVDDMLLDAVKEVEEDFTAKEEMEEPDPEVLNKGERDGDPKGRLPYIISEEEFAYGDQSYGKVTITFYEKDEVLTDTDGSVMVAERVIGEEALRVIRDEDDVVYVRNERLGMDYEVVATDEWFVNPDEGGED